MEVRKLIADERYGSVRKVASRLNGLHDAENVIISFLPLDADNSPRGGGFPFAPRL